MKYPVGTEVIYNGKPYTVVGQSILFSDVPIIESAAGAAIMYVDDTALSLPPRSVEDIAWELVDNYYRTDGFADSPYKTLDVMLVDMTPIAALHALVVAAIEEAMER